MPLTYIDTRAFFFGRSKGREEPPLTPVEAQSKDGFASPPSPASRRGSLGSYLWDWSKQPSAPKDE